MKRFLGLLFICLSYYAQGQNTILNGVSLKADYHCGFLLPEYKLFNYLVNKPIQAFDIELTKDLKGTKLWQRVYHYPSVGLSYYYGSLGNDTVFGKVHVLYPFLSFPLLDRKRILLSARIGVGAAYASHKFDVQKNYYNIAIASNFNIWFRTALDFSYRLNEKINLLSGMTFGHFSNANLEEPNLGLNLWTFYTGANYYIGRRAKRDTTVIPPFKSKNEYAIIAAGSGKHTRRFAERSYFAASLSAEYKRILGYKGALGAGVDFFYDSSIPDEMRREGYTEIKEQYRVKTGVHLSQELIVGDFSLIIQEGIYLGFTDRLNKHIMYNRGIVRYRISKHFFVNLGMKTNLWILDVAELGAGYYFRTKP